MHSNQTFNILVLEEVDKLPFPAEIQKEIGNIKWKEFEWRALGLPAYNSKFNVTNGELYFESDAEGKIDLHKEEFTGEIVIQGVLVNPNNCNLVFFLMFELVFCRGVLQEASLSKTQTISKTEYDLGFLKFSNTIDKQMKYRQSWWFKYLYYPYFKTLTYTTGFLVGINQFCMRLLIFCVHKLTPLKV